MAEEGAMSPEEIAQAARQQCIFCHIAAGRVASKKVYEDDRVVVVLDINPANPGHVLIIPKEHYVIMPQIPEDVLAHIGMVAKGISHAQLRSLKAQGTNIFVANGVTAGQRAQHFMMHVIPRMENDGVGLVLPERGMAPADAKKAQQVLRKALAKALGLKAESEPETGEESQAPKDEMEKEGPAEKKAPAKKAAAKKEAKKPARKAKEVKPAQGANLDDIARLLAR
ncbi:MAG: HIT domain-containing protein [Candidatus Woesearchaeota archaeon]